MFKVRMLPAGYGDCLWIEYGTSTAPHRILIDAGTVGTYKTLRKRIQTDLADDDRRFTLFMVTHVDTDHIDAAVKLLNSPSLKLDFDQVWFNGWKQLIDKDLLGPQQGEYLTALVEKRRIPHNVSFKGRPAFIPEKGKLPRAKLPGGMVLTLLSPGVGELRLLRDEWKKTMGKAAGNSKAALKKLAATPKYKDTLGPAKAPDVNALAAAESNADGSPANASSIAVLAEYEDRCCLFAGDAYPDVLEASIDRLIEERGITRLQVDLFKVPHHGSQCNNTIGLHKRVCCPKYLVSTDGKIYHHPDPEAIARIIKHGGPNPTLYFNYETERTKVWDNAALKRRYRYEVVIRPDATPAMEIDLSV